MVNFYMMVGLPGSGKTTYAKKLCSEWAKDGRNLTRVGTDDIREELFGDESIQTGADRVFKIALERVVRCINEYNSVVLDATNLSSKRRVSFVNNVKRLTKNNFRSVAIVVCTDFDECCRRNIGRTRKVPQEVLDRMIRQFQCPYEGEGFDHIIFAGLEKHLPEFSPDKFVENVIGDFDQKTPYHKYDLSTHCKKVAEQFLKHDYERYVAGYLHDYGKLFTQVIDENGVAHYYGHENVGAYRIMCLAGHFYDFVHDQYGTLLANVLFYINHHMHIRDIIKSEKAIKKYKDLWGENRFNKLVEFMEADNKASGREV